jgi:peptidoglycan/xylan/chitin deacetylase (PgdA/CDA1 family)
MMWMAGNRWVGRVAGGCMAGVFFCATLHGADLSGRWRLEVETLHWSQHQRVTFYDGAGKVVHSEKEDSVDDPAGLLKEKTWGSVIQTEEEFEGSYDRSTFCSGQALTPLTGTVSEDDHVVFTAVFPGRGESCSAQGVPFYVEYSDMLESFEGVYDPARKLVTGAFTARQDRKRTTVYQGSELWGYAYFEVDDTDIVRTGKFSIEVQPKEFMITFDDGPVPGKSGEPGNTEKILDALSSIYVDGEPVRAGFFMVGVGCCENSTCYCPWYDRWPPKGSVRNNGVLVRMVARAGHCIGVHTQHHPDFDPWFKHWSVEDIRSEISGCYEEIRRALNSDDPNAVELRKIFRPPYFRNTPDVRKAAEGYQIVLGAGKNEDSAVDVGGRQWTKARRLIESWDRDYPCVLTFHDIIPGTAENIADIIAYLRKQGFTLAHFDPDRLPGSLPSGIHQATYVIHPSETARHTVVLDSTISVVTFTVSWEGSDLDLVLHGPDGTRVDPARASFDSRVKYAEKDTYEYYTIARPNAGSWMMVVSSVNVPQEGEKYTIRVEADTDLALYAFTGRPDFALNEQIGIRAELVNGENQTAGAALVARIRRPDSSVEEFTLYDDGTHGDEHARDGSYANAYSNTSLRGSYEIAVTAAGLLSGDQYERTSSLSVTVGSITYVDVDLDAYAVFADHWMAHNCTEPSWCDTADIDQSGAVDIFDLCLLAERWLGRTP